MGSKAHVFGATATTTTLAVTGSRVTGAKQTLTATVAPAAEGTVTFDDGTTALGSAAVRNGTASISVTLPVGTRSVRATFAPSSEDWSGSSSAAVPVTIARVASTTSLQLAPTTPYGAGSTVKVTVTDAADAATGIVEIREGTKVIAKAMLVGGKGTDELPATLGVGTHVLTAVYPGSLRVAGSTSPAVTVKVTRSTSSTTVRLSSPRVTYGTTAKATVTVTAATAPVSGTVAVREGGKTVATGRLAVSGRTGKVTVKLPATIAVGRHTLTAVFGGTTTVAGSSGTAALTVAKAKARVAISAATWTVKKNARPTVTVTVRGATAPTGKVTVRIGGKKVATRTVHGGRVVVRLPKVPRSTSVTATYEGSSSYLRTSVTHKVRVR
nr:Ig-like domain-containing protein [Cellulomonas sp. JH27-2]